MIHLSITIVCKVVVYLQSQINLNIRWICLCCR